MESVVYNKNINEARLLPQRPLKEAEFVKTATHLLTRDLIKPSAKEASRSEKSDNYPTLPSPSQSLKDQEQRLGTNEEGSVIAVMGEILALQAKSNSAFWQTLWKEGGVSMRFAVELAPLIATAVKTSFDEQANISEHEASMAMIQGFTNIAAGAISIGMGGFSAGKEMLGNGTPEEAENLLGVSKEAQDEGDLDSQELLDDADASTNADNRQSSSWDKLKSRLTSAPTKATMEFLSKTFEKGYQHAVLMNFFVTGTTSLSEYQYKNKIASDQRAAGAADAFSKQAEQFQQYYNQNFDREEELRQGSQQNLDQAMQILKSISDAVTSTTQSMFRG